MKRLLGLALLLACTVAAVYAYTAWLRDQNYRQLVDQGEAALAADDTSTAIAAFSGAIVLKSDSMIGYLKRGEAYRRRNDFDAALPDLRRAAELDPISPRPLELLGDVSYALNRFPRAADHYQACVRLDDRSPRVLYKLGLARYSSGQPAPAADALRQTVALDPNFAEAYYLLGLCYRDLQKPQESLGALDRAVRLAPAMLQAREELGDLHGQMGHRDARIAELEVLRALDPSPAREIALGLEYARAGQPQSAIVTLGRAADRYPDQPSAYVALGRFWLEKAVASRDRVDLGKALGALQGAAIADDGSEALTLYGRALLLARQDEEAERTLQRASEKRPVDPLAFYYLAEAAERRGHIDAARHALLDYDALTADDRDRAAFAVRVATLSMQVGDAASAAAWFSRAIGRDEPEPALMVRLADAQIRSGALDAARATLARVLDKEPAHRAALALQRRLR